jgi:hypothetical protein
MSEFSQPVTQTVEGLERLYQRAEIQRRILYCALLALVNEQDHGKRIDIAYKALQKISEQVKP